MSKKESTEIMPIEYHLKVPKKKNPRLQIYWDYSFSPNLSQNVMDWIVQHTRKKKRVSVQVLDELVLWHYPGKPQICLNKLTRKVFVSKKTLKQFGRKSCQQQASLVLRILKGTKKHPIGLANFKRISATFNPYRIGKTAKEREITFQAAHDLFNDRLKDKTIL